MGKIILSEFEKRRLITEYRSELRQLLYQVSQVTEHIQSLSESLAEPESANLTEILDLANIALGNEPGERKAAKTTSKPKAIKRSTSSKKTQAKRKTKGPGRPPKGSNIFTYTTQNGEKHELGDWDQLMIKSIHEAKQPLINAELLDIAMDTALGKKIGAKEARLMISRTIHKLVNRKSILKKVDYDGRGNAYATEGMVNANGKVKKEYKRQ